MATFKLPIYEWIRYNCEAYEKHSVDIPWNIIFPIALWLLWKQRNLEIFEGVTSSRDLHRSFLEGAAEFYAALPSHTRPENIILHFGWSPPREGWFKLNTDGSALGNPGKAGIGGIIRDSNGRWVKGFWRYLGYTNSLIAELWGAREDILLGKDLNIHALCLELDAKVIYEMIWGSTSAHTMLMDLILDCLSLATSFRDFQVRYVRR